QLYGQRWGIETSFRDIKDYKFGMGMGDVHISNPVRRDVSIHRNSIDTGKMRRSSLDPTFLLA
ncbi:hypothetical protein, partial [Aeromonas caviae]|uniref:hypothetical protein n=1 Tax=Aeromonas caviae TaxID=648 RepID=UPI001FC88C50